MNVTPYAGSMEHEPALGGSMEHRAGSPRRDDRCGTWTTPLFWVERHIHGYPWCLQDDICGRYAQFVRAETERVAWV
jgi:hypothetical protein